MTFLRSQKAHWYRAFKITKELVKKCWGWWAGAERRCVEGWVVQFSATVEPHFTTTPLIRSSCYYGHFILARNKAQSVILVFKEPFNTATPLIRPDFCGPLVTGLRFHCTHGGKAILFYERNYIGTHFCKSELLTIDIKIFRAVAEILLVAGVQ